MNPLLELLNLPSRERIERGLEHTPREIFQQPETWEKTFQRCRQIQEQIANAVRSGGIRGGGKAPTVYLIGAGTSDYVGRALTPLLRRCWSTEAWAIPSTTLLADFDEFHRAGRDYFWISFSRSGQSPEGVALLERALRNHCNIHHLVITCNQNGEMAKLCQGRSGRALAIVLDETTNDRGLAMTSSFSNMLVAGQCAAHIESLDDYGKILTQMADAGSRFLPQAAEVAESVANLDCCRIIFVGSGALHGVAQECALKSLELSGGQVVAMAETPLGLRHGPLSSLNQQAAFVAFLSSNARHRGYELDLLEEIAKKRLGKIRIAISANGAGESASMVDHMLSLNCPGLGDDYRPVVDVIFGQLLGLFNSLRCGLKPDQPSPNGAIHRVVAPIKLYS